MNSKHLSSCANINYLSNKQISVHSPIFKHCRKKTSWMYKRAQSIYQSVNIKNDLSSFFLKWVKVLSTGVLRVAAVASPANSSTAGDLDSSPKQQRNEATSARWTDPRRRHGPSPATWWRYLATGDTVSERQPPDTQLQQTCVSLPARYEVSVPLSARQLAASGDRSPINRSKAQIIEDFTSSEENVLSEYDDLAVKRGWSVWIDAYVES